MNQDSPAMFLPTPRPFRLERVCSALHRKSSVPHGGTVLRSTLPRVASLVNKVRSDPRLLCAVLQ